MSKKLKCCLERYSLKQAAFLQALFLVIYCFLVGIIFWRGNTWFKPLEPWMEFLTPVLFLLFFSVSVLVCTLLVFGYPALLLWQEKKPAEAIKLLTQTAGWLILFVLILLTVFVVY